MTYGIDYTTTRELAPRTYRLLAVLVDGLLFAAFATVATLGGFAWAADAVVKSAATGQLSWPEARLSATSATLIFGSLAAALLFTVYQWYTLAVRGQTLGKQLLGIQIVDGLGAPAGFLRALLLRSWVFGVLVSLANGLLGGAGGLLSLADVLMIFGAEQRCLHDRLAGTWVRTTGESPLRALGPLALFGGGAAALVALLVAKGPGLPSQELRQVLARHEAALSDPAVLRRLVEREDDGALSSGRAGPMDDVVLRGPRATGAGLYRWVDESGAENFADELEAVPAKYRKQARPVR